MQAEAEAEAAPPAPVDILCPVCETLVSVSGDEMECPNCGAPLEV
jgi:rubrerythrin